MTQQPKAKKNQSLSLDVTPAITKEMGNTLLSAALEKERQGQADEIVASVQLLLKERDTAREWEQRNREAAEHAEARLRAIEAGAFTLVRTTIVYKEKHLNEPYGHTLVVRRPQ